MTEEEYALKTGKDLSKPHMLKGFETGHHHSPKMIKTIDRPDDCVPKCMVGDWVIFLDPTTRRDAFGQVGRSDCLAPYPVVHLGMFPLTLDPSS